MSYFNIAKGLTGRVRGTAPTPLSLAQEAVQDAIGKIYDQTDWSFQRAITYGGWLCPGQVANVGTCSVTPYSPTVVADATATQAIANGTAASRVLLTTLQFRSPSYSLYNIIAADNFISGTVAYVTVFTPGSGQTPGTYSVAISDTGAGTGGVAQITVNPNGTVTLQPVILSPGSGYTNPFILFSEGGTPATFAVFLNLTLTLDRPWTEPITGPMYYMIYQAYFVSPVPDFRKFIEVRDTTNAARLDFWSMTEAELSIRDPQRTEFADPSFVVPAGIDQRPGSSTFGYAMFELWPQQLSTLPYSFSFRRRGIVPQTYSDFQTLSPPYPITEELVRWRAKETLYQDAAAQMEAHTPGSGRGLLMLSQQAGKEYANVLDKILAIDVNINGEMFTKIEGRGTLPSNRPYSNQLGQLNIGGYPER